MIFLEQKALRLATIYMFFIIAMRLLPRYT
jgi:hypothetical protein